jgi:hypothetical protein
MAVAAQTRRSEGGYPVLSWAQIGAAIYTMTLVALLVTVWGVASFRAGHTTPQTTQMLNDVGWFIVLFPFQPADVWFIAVALAIFWDRREDAPYPRWLGWLNLWLATITVPAGLIVFFKRGAFAWNGAIAFYPPLTAFFVFTIVMAAYTIKAINRKAAAQERTDARVAVAPSPSPAG